ncbi:MAG TPA: hypothetical protein VJS92_14690 [Candidatus Polarisedimenticolaceae bacterium]|nr:hypothetical protein [Candidatus Polarisedimenticolaceae bacterium]
MRPATIRLALLVLAAGLAVGASWAIPNCAPLCTSGNCEQTCFAVGSHCSNYSITTINGQGYCFQQCWNGNSGYSVCHAGGGSPVFRKFPVEEG